MENEGDASSQARLPFPESLPPSGFASQWLCVRVPRSRSPTWTLCSCWAAWILSWEAAWRVTESCIRQIASGFNQKFPSVKCTKCLCLHFQLLQLYQFFFFLSKNLHCRSNFWLRPQRWVSLHKSRTIKLTELKQPTLCSHINCLIPLTLPKVTFVL